MTSDPGSAHEQPPLPRIGDAERQAAVDELSEHYVAGRLDEAEFNQRMDTALQARTIADLVPLFTDLPPINPAAPWAAAPLQRRSAVPYVSRSQVVPAPTAPSSSAVEPGWVNVLRVVRPVIWPVAIGLIIFTNIPTGVLIVAAIILTIVSSRVLGDKKHSPGQLPHGSDDRRQLPPGR
ncbi:DUF1707 domain-containing protein [Raineyella sp. LH-20]|uniref:DUF1707 SHOCT-like domain-containing protein n=1 Tax=Raineyella sp. LH-20 TaxID=3081204 RepID=UPI002952AF2E|nr:DUF1707 domain-containing protein [Raineyella sp. LH-20]WOP19114.1 DUF1707 domain-containing protein [Raineyella sp. LH-20]